ncbi:MAG: hypothetical protein WC294_02980 [Methanoregula sp.]|jgi:hypothetical protein
MALWTPAEIATNLWLDASDASTITIDTGVSQWADKSGNNDHAVQATTSLQPAVVSASLNGLDTLFFDGSASLAVAGLTTPATANTFVVWNKPTSGGVANQRIFSSGPTNADDYTVNGVYLVCPTASSGVSAGGPGLVSNAWGNVSKELQSFWLGRVNRTATAYYYGRIAEIVIANTLSIDDFQRVEGYLAWKWGVTANLPADHPYKSAAPTISDTALIQLLSQPYQLEGTLRRPVDQPYSLLATYLAKLDQLYGLQLLALLAQHYGDVPVRLAKLDQYWGAAAELKKILREVYGSNPVVQNTLTESYNLLTSLLSRSDAKYSLIGDQLVNYVGVIYALNDSDKLLSALRERYAIALGGTSGQISASVNIAGGVVASGGFNLTYSMDEYCGSCDVTINNEQSWENINYLDPIVLTIESNTYNFVVVEKYLAESPGKPVFRIRGRSHSVTLDFPHATEIKDDLLVNGLCSEVVDAIAGIGGKAVDWYIPTDESITAKDVQIAGSSPMGAIKKIVNEFRAVVQTSPDGTIRAIPSHNVNTDKYNVSTITATIDAIKEVSSCEWGSEKRQGYNKYFVSNQAATGGYVLESKAMSEILDHIMASIVPWTNKPVYLTTSELTNVWIEAKGITEEIIEEEVEIKNGSGKLQKPWYGTISVDYGTRIDLGTPVFVEDGSLSVAGLASSMAMVKYKTRYWLWAVTGTDKENVQYILMSY